MWQFAPESSETAPYCGCEVVHEGNTGAGKLPDEIRLVSHLLLAQKEKKYTNPTKHPTQKYISKGQNSAWHWKGTLLTYLIWKTAWEFEEGCTACLWSEGFVTVWLLFHCPREDKWGGREGKRRGHPFSSMQQGNGSGGKVVGPWKWSGEADVLLHTWGLWDSLCFHKTG